MHMCTPFSQLKSIIINCRNLLEGIDIGKVLRKVFACEILWFKFLATHLFRIISVRNKSHIPLTFTKGHWHLFYGDNLGIAS